MGALDIGGYLNWGCFVRKSDRNPIAWKMLCRQSVDVDANRGREPGSFPCQAGHRNQQLEYASKVIDKAISLVNRPNLRTVTPNVVQSASAVGVSS
jgi:hypothetical protein